MSLTRAKGHVHLLDCPDEPELAAVGGARRAEAVTTSAQSLAGKRDSYRGRDRKFVLGDLLSADEEPPDPGAPFSFSKVGRAAPELLR